MEILKPSIFDGHPVMAGMSMRGSHEKYPPHGYTFRQIGDMHTDEFAIHSRALEQEIGSGLGKRIVSLQQVHGNNIYQAEDIESNQGDGIFTQNNDITIAVSLADCCGIVFYDIRNKIIMILHSGWRGTKEQIGPKGISILAEKHGSHPEDLLVWLTPCAGKEAYAVGSEFVELFPNHVKSKGTQAFVFDLQGAIQDSLIQSGVKESHIEAHGVCTITDQRFHSYRRDGNKGRNVAFITLAG